MYTCKIGAWFSKLEGHRFWIDYWTKDESPTENSTSITIFLYYAVKCTCHLLYKLAPKWMAIRDFSSSILKWKEVRAHVPRVVVA